MIILEAHLSPSLANWIFENFNIETFSANYLNLQSSSDFEIFEFGKINNGIIITKDDDFPKLISSLESPPKIIW